MTLHFITKPLETSQKTLKINLLYKTLLHLFLHFTLIVYILLIKTYIQEIEFNF